MKSATLLFFFPGIPPIACNQQDHVAKNAPQANKNEGNREPGKNPANEDIDALQALPSNFRLLLEHEYVRVLEYVLNPGEKDVWHTHPAQSSYDVSGGNLTVDLENGTLFPRGKRRGRHHGGSYRQTLCGKYRHYPCEDCAG